VWTGDTLGEGLEERHHDLGELGGLDDVQNLLELVQEHHLLGTVHLRPELKEGHYHLGNIHTRLDTSEIVHSKTW